MVEDIIPHPFVQHKGNVQEEKASRWRRKKPLFSRRRRGRPARRIRVVWEPFCGCVEGCLNLQEGRVRKGSTQVCLGPKRGNGTHVYASRKLQDGCVRSQAITPQKRVYVGLFGADLCPNLSRRGRGFT